MVNSRPDSSTTSSGVAACRAASRPASRSRRRLDAASPRAASLAEQSLRTFIIGAENRRALAAVQGVLEENGARFSPLTFVGPPGCGKTHLLAGLAAAWRERFPAENVVAENAADFAREFVAAIRQDHKPEFRGRIRAADVLILDDLDQFATKPASQQELLATLDELHAHAGLAIFAARAHPGLLRELAPALRSRLIGGLVAPLHPAGPDSRRTILLDLLSGLRLHLADDARDALAERSASVRQMQALVSLLAQPNGPWSPPVGELVWLEHVAQLLATHAGQATVTLRRVAERTARHFSLKVADLRSPSRRHSLVFARDVGMFLARELTAHSLNQVGAYFGGRDHTTVMHGCRKIEDLVKTDPTTRQTVDRLRAALVAE